jgi:hypothetical protein
MIIFDYATLADDSHRRHLIKRPPMMIANPDPLEHPIVYNEEYLKFIPDYESYYREAANDKSIKIVCEIYNRLYEYNIDFEIWADIPESYREQTKKWLENAGSYDELAMCKLRMRPDGDTTPWHELKEKWLKQDDALALASIEMAFEPTGSPMIPIWKKYWVPVMEVHV